jgi:hypothetical protein
MLILKTKNEGMKGTFKKARGFEWIISKILSSHLHANLNSSSAVE